MAVRAALALAALAIAIPAAAADDDGYCQRVRAVAAADAALGLAPTVFAAYGYVEGPTTIAAPDPTANATRTTLGAAYRVTGAIEGLVTRSRAGADCRRYQAASAIAEAARAQALAAQLAVLEEALTEVDALVLRTEADVAARRATAPELVALRLRARELRAFAATTSAELRRLPTAEARPLDRALARLRDADADVESREATLRVLRALDVTVRVGYDSFADRVDDTPYFAAVSASVNLGVVWQLVANRDAAAGRRRQLERAPGGAANRARLEAELADEQRRAGELATLVDELDKQHRELRSIGGESSRRLAQTVWFDLARSRAEHAYLEAHVAALSQILGEAGR